MKKRNKKRRRFRGRWVETPLGWHWVSEDEEAQSGAATVTEAAQSSATTTTEAAQRKMTIVAEEPRSETMRVTEGTRGGAGPWSYEMTGLSFGREHLGELWAQWLF